MTGEILDGMRRLLEAARGGALATITRTSGSTYQREGAKMLCAPDGTLIGSISGGCLEADVCEVARGVVERGAPVRRTYDTNAANDNVWGLGLGCNGTVEILVESLDWWRSDPGRAVFAALAQRLDAGAFGVLVTVLKATDEPSAHMRRVFIGTDDSVTGSLEAPALDRFAVEHARRLLPDSGAGGTIPSGLVVAEGAAELFFDLLVPATRLLVIGSGTDVRPLVQMARTLGMRVTVIDGHPEPALRARVPDADAVVSARPEAIRAVVSFAGRPALVLMTHNYLKDIAALEQVLAAEEALDYIGVLGPRARTAQMLDELRARGVALREEHVAAVRTPIGLDLGARSPAEIALAVLAEVLAVKNRRSALPLRDKHAAVGKAA